MVPRATSIRKAERARRARAWRLLESGRIRRLAGGALLASLGVHGGSFGVAVRAGTGSPVPSEDGPISVRYLLPPDRVQAPAGERIRYARVGAPGAGEAVAGAQDGGQGGGASPAPAGGAPGAPSRERSPDVGDRPEPTTIYTEAEVDSVVAHDPASGGPAYPEPLRARGVEGLAVVEFTVDTTGRADSASFRVLEATDARFADAVRDALPRMRFRPAVAHGRHVPQLVRLPMVFRIQPQPNG